MTPENLQRANELQTKIEARVEDLNNAISIDRRGRSFAVYENHCGAEAFAAICELYFAPIKADLAALRQEFEAL